MIHKALGGWLVLGAIQMVGVASGVIFGRPFPIDTVAGVTRARDVLAVWGIGYAVVATLAVIDAVSMWRRRELDRLQHAANLTKLTAAWYFVFNLVGLGLLLFARLRAETADLEGVLNPDSLINGLLFVALPTIVLFLVATYVVMVPTSAYGLAALSLLRRDGALRGALYWLNAVLHFLFILDIFSTVLVVELARQHLGRARAPRTVTKNLLTGVVGLCSIPALASVIPVAAVAASSAGVFGFSALQPATENRLLDVVEVLLIATPVAISSIVILPGVPTITFRTSVQLCLQDDLESLRQTTRNVKLAAIPLFIQNFFVSAGLVGALTLLPVAASRGLVLLFFPIGLPIVAAFGSVGFVPTVTLTYLMMLVTSCSGVACVAALKSRRVVTSAFCIINTVLHLIFVADIVSTLVVAARAKQQLTGAGTAL